MSIFIWNIIQKIESVNKCVFNIQKITLKIQMGNLRSIPIITKNSVGDFIGKSICGVCAMSEMEGWRKEMEDSRVLEECEDYIIMGVFDGHGGNSASLFCKDNFVKLFKHELQKITSTVFTFQTVTPDNFKFALYNTFKQLDVEYLSYCSNNKHVSSGTTAIVSVITATHYIIANSGDSRAIIIDKNDRKTIFSTVDHKPTNPDETKRIHAAKHVVLNERVDGNLATSRAIGDFSFKEESTLTPETYAVTCCPDITIFEKPINGSFLVLACDGIWDVLTNTSIISHMFDKNAHIFTRFVEFEENTIPTTIVKQTQEINKSKKSTELDTNIISELCEHIINVAFDLGSKDNISIGIYSC